VCGPSGDDVCYQALLKGGFPFAYVFDDPGVSVRGQLGILEDEFRFFPFSLDVVVFGSVIWLTLSLVYKIMGNQKPPT
jgi:hypothetical protein